MDFDQMLEIWRAQNTAASYDVNREALRRSLQAEEERVRRKMRARRREIWLGAIFGTGMAIWAGFWIAITITNGWPAIYALAAAASLVIFAFGAGALWLSRGREPERKFGNTLQEEVRRSLALVDYRLSLTGHGLRMMLGTTAIVVGAGLFTWTVNASQDIQDQSSFGGWFLFSFAFVVLIVWAFRKERDAMREAKPKLELRQKRLRELLETLDAGE